MKLRTKVILLYAVIMLSGWIAGVFLRCRYGISVTFTFFTESGIEQTRDLFSFLILFYHVVRLALMIFISGFTVFAPFVTGMTVLYGGAMFGCLSAVWQRSVFLTPGGCGMVLLSSAIMLLHIYLGSEAVIHRLHIRTLAPTARMFLRSPDSRRYICCFMYTSTMLLGISVLYWFTDWFSGIL